MGPGTLVAVELYPYVHDEKTIRWQIRREYMKSFDRETNTY